MQSITFGWCQARWTRLPREPSLKGYSGKSGLRPCTLTGLTQKHPTDLCTESTTRKGRTSQKCEMAGNGTGTMVGSSDSLSGNVHKGQHRETFAHAREYLGQADSATKFAGSLAEIVCTRSVCPIQVCKSAKPW